jgi:peptidoglycan/xylan/chitin deacetylase (PgdA/CDA1 family)
MLKKRIIKIITSSGILLKVLNMVASDMPRVFVWHRFAAPMENRNGRVSADLFGWQLDRIRQDFQVLSLGGMLDYYNRHGKWPKRCVVLTIDDGYHDFYQWAYPELKKRCMKATFFATVNFVEGKIWLWPDRVRWALDTTLMSEVTLMFHDEMRRFPLNGLHDKDIFWKSCSDHCITLSDDKKEMFIRSMEEALQVSCPDIPTEEYRAVTWDELRELNEDGIEIGSHTMNHPILSKINQSRLVDEIEVSKKVLEENLNTKITSFCYPNGRFPDISDEVVRTVRDSGYLGAVMCIYSLEWQIYKIPRMGVSSDRENFLWKLYGAEKLLHSKRKE